MFLALLVHTSVVLAGPAAITLSTEGAGRGGGQSAPLWGLSASRRSAFRGHGPMPAIDAAAEKLPLLSECATSGFALEKQFDGPVLATVATAKTAEACCDACSYEDSCERWVFGTHHLRSRPPVICHFSSRL